MTEFNEPLLLPPSIVRELTELLRNQAEESIGREPVMEAEALYEQYLAWFATRDIASIAYAFRLEALLGTGFQSVRSTQLQSSSMVKWLCSLLCFRALGEHDYARAMADFALANVKASANAPVGSEPYFFEHFFPAELCGHFCLLAGRVQEAEAYYEKACLADRMMDEDNECAFSVMVNDVVWHGYDWMLRYTIRACVESAERFDSELPLAFHERIALLKKVLGGPPGD